MKILNVSVHQFRNLSNKQFTFASQFTLISGSHGSGKSSLLDALALLVAEFSAGMGVAATSSRETAMLVAKGDLEGKALDWGYRRSEKDKVQHGGGLFGEAERVMETRKGESAIQLPVFAYYSRAGERGLLPGDGPFPDQYARCLDPIDPSCDFAGLTGPEEACVRSAMTSIASVDPQAGSPRGGLGRLASMAGDMALRCSRLNPELGDRAAVGTEGVVLIEELECGLHPSRQRRVIEDLRKAFPLVQFIATTYSPFIIQSLDEGILIDLDFNEPRPYPDLSIEDITETILGIPLPQRSKRYLDMNAAATEYLSVLQQAEGADGRTKERVKRRLDQLMMPFSNQQAFCAVLEAERLMSGVDDEEME
jgi:predicted ATPase